VCVRQTLHPNDDELTVCVLFVTSRRFLSNIRHCTNLASKLVRVSAFKYVCVTSLPAKSQYLCVYDEEGVRGQKNDRRRRPGAPRSSATLIDSARRKNARADECEAKMQISRGEEKRFKLRREGGVIDVGTIELVGFSSGRGRDFAVAEPRTRRTDGALASLNEYFPRRFLKLRSTWLSFKRILIACLLP